MASNGSHGKPHWYSGDGDCPHCGAVDALESPTPKGVVHWVVDRYTVHGVLDFRRCEACRRSSYAITLSVIADANVSDEWSNEYFWSSKPKNGRTTVATMKLRGLPKEWRVTHIETPAGVMERHFFGPFPAGSEGRKVWALNGSTKGPWNHADWILCKFGERLTAETRKNGRQRKADNDDKRA